MLLPIWLNLYPFPTKIIVPNIVWLIYICAIGYVM